MQLSEFECAIIVEALENQDDALRGALKYEDEPLAVAEINAARVEVQKLIEKFRPHAAQ